MFAKGLKARTYVAIALFVVMAVVFGLGLIWDAYASTAQVDLRSPFVVRNTLLTMDAVPPESRPNTISQDSGWNFVKPVQSDEFLAKRTSSLRRSSSNNQSVVGTPEEDAQMVVPWVGQSSFWDKTSSNETYPFSQLIVMPEAKGCQTGEWVPIVLSKPADFIERDTTRRTMKHFSQGRASPVFVLGRPMLKGTKDLERPVMIELIKEAERLH